MAESILPALSFEFFDDAGITDRASLSRFLVAESKNYSSVIIDDGCLKIIDGFLFYGEEPSVKHHIVFDLPVIIDIVQYCAFLKIYIVKLSFLQGVTFCLQRHTTDLIVLDCVFHNFLNLTSKAPNNLDFTNSKFREITEYSELVKPESRKISFLKCKHESDITFENRASDKLDIMKFESCQYLGRLLLQNLKFSSASLVIKGIKCGRTGQNILAMAAIFDIDSCNFSSFEISDIQETHEGIVIIEACNFTKYSVIKNVNLTAEEEKEVDIDVSELDIPDFLRPNSTRPEIYYNTEMSFNETDFRSGLLISNVRLNKLPDTRGTKCAMPPDLVNFSVDLSEPHGASADIVLFKQFCEGVTNAKFIDELKRIELEIDRHTSENKVFRTFATIYKYSSNYGFSVTRPLISAAITVMVFAIVFAILSQEFDYTYYQDYNSILALSLSNMLPILPSFTEQRSILLTEFFGKPVGFFTSLLIMLQNLISILLIFLLGLGLRNMFKLSG